MKKNKQKISKNLKIIVFLVLLVLLFTIILINRKSSNPTKIAAEGSYLTIGNEEIQIENITSSTEINPPVVGARNDTNKME